MDGPTADIAKGLVDKAVAVETGTDGLLGYGYFDKDTGSMYQNPDDSGATLRGDWDIYRAAEFAREAGFPVTEDNHQQVFGTAPAPTSASDAALYAGTYNLGQYNDAFTWRTGAIGFDFNSDAAQGFRNGTKWCGGALLKGIAVTGGAIDEPYAPLIPKYDGVFKNIFEGANVGDALARNTPALKWKLINIGDPLYQPTLGRYMPAALNPLPYPWSFVDINANPGGANLIKNTAKVIAVGDLPSFEVRSYGLTLYGNSDSCNFTYMPLDGDGSVTVRVGRTEAIDYHAVAGVTFRESTAPDSRYIAVMIDGEGQLQTRIRTVPGQDSALTTIGGENENPYPIWLQIYRSGNTFHGYKSTDGYNWTEIINQTISLPSTALVGLVTVSGNASVPNKAFYDNVVVQGQFYCGGGVPIPKH